MPSDQSTYERNTTCLSLANVAFAKGEYTKAITLYLQFQRKRPDLAKLVEVPIAIAKKRSAKEKKSASPFSTELPPKEVETANARADFSGQSTHYRATVSIKESFPGLAVVVPVYNALAETKKCLSSLTKHTPETVRVIIVNDASSEPGIADLLNEYRNKSSVEIYANTANKGFTHTINRGICLASELDVIILNSDTEVTSGWSRRLTLAAYSQPYIGTVTAVSNSAGAFSVPNQGINRVPAEGLAAVASSLSRLSECTYPEAPTGNGFCLYLKRECLRAVGPFDANAFPRGYGEENDFCMRATKMGWRHIIDSSTYIYHARTASFGDSKEALLAAGRQIINERYPEYTTKARAFAHGDSLKKTRQEFISAIQQIDSSIDNSSPRVLYILPKLSPSGGTPQTNRDLMEAVSTELGTFLLTCDSSELSFGIYRKGRLVPLEGYLLKAPISPFPHCSDEYDCILIDICIRYDISVIHYRHIAFHSQSAPPLLSALGIRLILSIHDFYLVCPTVKLIDNNSSYCSGVCSPGEGKCTYDLWRSPALPSLKHEAIEAWTSMSTSFVQSFDSLITTSGYAKSLIVKRLPTTKRLHFHIIPHGRNFSKFLSPSMKDFDGKKLRILVPGAITVAKGALVLSQLAKILAGRVEFHLLGKLSREVDIPELIQHGSYDREDFINRIQGIKIEMHLGAVFSIWPETYCHTLTELWASGLPCLGFNLGAVGERISSTGAGWLAEKPSCEGMIHVIESILASPDSLLEKRCSVKQWQMTEGKERTTDWMARQYLRIYFRYIKVTQMGSPEKNERRGS